MKWNRFRISLILSLLAHIVLAGVIWLEPAFLLPSPSKPIKTEIEFVDAAELLKQLKNQDEKQAKGQIVDQSETAVNDEVPTNTKYLSRHNQKIVKETQAALSGDFRNTTGSRGPEHQEQKPGETQQDSNEKKLSQNREKSDQKQPSPKSEVPAEDKSADALADSDSDSETKSDRKNRLTDAHSPVSLAELKPDFKPKHQPLGSRAAGGGNGPSATNDHLNVPLGMQTLLSTREFMYYSYYNRIKEKLRQTWEPKIKEKMERILRQGRTIASENERITKVVIVLNRVGTLVRVQVVGASGVIDLDDAAIEAFKAAAPFPNPPKGIVEDDGLIRIRWDFILEAASNAPVPLLPVAKINVGAGSSKGWVGYRYGYGYES